MGKYRYRISLRMFNAISQSERNTWVSYKVQHVKRSSISSSNHVLFCLLYKHTGNSIFDNSPKISDHFPKISKDSQKIVQSPHQRFWIFSENFRRLPKISEGNGRLPKTFKEDPKMFWSFMNKFKYRLMVKHDISEVINIFTSEEMENTTPESRMWFLWILRVVNFILSITLEL